MECGRRRCACVKGSEEAASWSLAAKGKTPDNVAWLIDEPMDLGHGEERTYIGTGSFRTFWSAAEIDRHASVLS